MSDTTKIEWTDASFNPWIGCTKVAPECDNCYADAQDKFRKWTPEGWGAGKPRRLTKTWGDPVKWNAKAEAAGVRKRVFCASLADVFDAEVPNEWRLNLWNLISATPNLDWQLLTKRPANIRLFQKWMAGADDISIADFQRNVWLGTSVGTKLRKPQIGVLMAVPNVSVRFVSFEPLLEDVGEVDLSGIHWAIIGGESGPRARACDLDWIRSLLRQCRAQGVAPFVKQLGKANRCAHDAAGGHIDCWPDDLKVREFPRESR
jgi:protein gp37